MSLVSNRLGSIVPQATNLLIRKLEGRSPLCPDDRALLEQCCRPVREFGPRQDFIREGDRPDSVFIVLSGFACRYKLVGNGRRQIMAYVVPGDFCDFQVLLLQRMDHSIGALSRCQVIELPRRTVEELSERPAIAKALWWASLVDAATLREWLANNSQRCAEERVAHLLCELLVRLEAVGLVQDDTFTLPITQTDIGDTVGISVVHANRMLMNLREAGLIELDGRNLVVKDVPRLKRFADFNPNYLHLGESSAGLEAGPDLRVH